MTQQPPDFIVGPVQTPDPITKGPVNFTYVIERFYMDVRDGFRVNARGRPYAKDGYQTFQNTYSWVKKYADAKGETDLFQISDAWIKGFIRFLYDCPISLNTVSGIVNNVHTISNALIMDGLALQKLTLRVWPEPTFAIYNSEQELKLLQKTKYSHETLKLARDIFLLQSYTGFRIGTLKRFLKDPAKYIFEEGEKWYLRIFTNKTGAQVTVPLKKFILKILKRRNFQFPAVYYENYYNPLIKAIGREAGLDQKITFSRTIAGKQVEFVKPKYALMSSHTARRNFITNAFLAKVPVDQLMLITGHRTREQFMKYIKADSLTNAIAVADLDFFQ